MPSSAAVLQHINRIVSYLVEAGLADDQSMAFQRRTGNDRFEITFPSAKRSLVALKNRDYVEIYAELVQDRAFNAKMLDGALIQMTYVFKRGTLERHRLAFFPAPHLEEFQNNPDIYLMDEVYAHVVARNIVPFPLRFDYDVSDELYVELEHPKSHLTLGQYERCRIPVSAPLTPYWFADFFLRNFYHTAVHRYAERLPISGAVFAETIQEGERRVVHVQVPVAT